MNGGGGSSSGSWETHVESSGFLGVDAYGWMTLGTWALVALVLVVFVLAWRRKSPGAD